jgi:hypothetical protein
LGVLVVKGVGNKGIPAASVAELPSSTGGGEAPAVAKTDRSDGVPGSEGQEAVGARKTAPTAAAATAPSPVASVTAPAPSAPEKEDRGSRSSRDSRSSERGSRSEREKTPEVKAPTPEKTIAKPPTGSKCDEVACLVDSSLPCCKKSGSSSSSSSSSSRASEDSGLPDSLSRTDIQSGMSGVRGRVMACNDEYKVPGTLIAKITITGGGDVSSARVEGKFAGTPSGSCVERAVKNARFKKWKGPSVVVTYPFSFR